VTLSAWDDPRCGDETQKVLTEGAEYIRLIHSHVLKAKARTADLNTIEREVFECLGLPEADFQPLFTKTIQAHLQANNI